MGISGLNIRGEIKGVKNIELPEVGVSSSLLPTLLTISSDYGSPSHFTTAASLIYLLPIYVILPV